MKTTTDELQEYKQKIMVLASDISIKMISESTTLEERLAYQFCLDKIQVIIDDKLTDKDVSDITKTGDY